MRMKLRVAQGSVKLNFQSQKSNLSPSDFLFLSFTHSEAHTFTVSPHCQGSSDMLTQDTTHHHRGLKAARAHRVPIKADLYFLSEPLSLGDGGTKAAETSLPLTSPCRRTDSRETLTTVYMERTQHFPLTQNYPANILSHAYKEPYAQIQGLCSAGMVTHSAAPAFGFQTASHQYCHHCARTAAPLRCLTALQEKTCRSPQLICISSETSMLRSTLQLPHQMYIFKCYCRMLNLNKHLLTHTQSQRLARSNL